MGRGRRFHSRCASLAGSSSPHTEQGYLDIVTQIPLLVEHRLRPTTPVPKSLVALPPVTTLVHVVDTDENLSQTHRGLDLLVASELVPLEDQVHGLVVPEPLDELGDVELVAVLVEDRGQGRDHESRHTAHQ